MKESVGKCKQIDFWNLCVYIKYIIVMFLLLLMTSVGLIYIQAINN